MRLKLDKIFLLLIITSGVCYGVYAKDIRRPEKSLLSSPNSEELSKTQRYIVIFKEKPSDYKKFIRSLDGELKHDYAIIEGMAVEMTAKMAKKLAKMPNVKSVQKALDFYFLIKKLLVSQELFDNKSLLNKC